MCRTTAVLLLIGIFQCGSAAYIGKFLGKLSELHHGVSGEVYAVDARTLHIKDFTYDGEGPAAYFYVGASRTPSNQKAFRVRDETGNAGVLKRYRRKSITLTLPEGKNLNNINWFSVWCDEFAVNFGDVKIPRNFDYPKPNKLEALRGVHGISSDPIVIVDAQTILIPHLSYDGEAPDAKFWVGRGPKPSPQGIRVPDENGKEVPLRRYDRKTVVLTLPGDLTVFDIGHFGIWCEAFTVDFGHVRIPQNLNVPPSLKMLGVSPQSKLNCEVLYEEQAFEVRWAVAGDSIVLQLVAKIDNGDYMSFGISGHPERNQMIGGDVVVAWVDRETMKGYAVDYYLQAKSQCSGPTGSCPDENFAENTNNIRLLNAAMVNGYSIVTYQRPLRPSDEFDQQIYTNASQAVIWGTGPLNQRNEVSFHTHFAKKNHFIDFGRPPKWNCPLPDNQEVSTTTEQAFEQVVTEEVIPDTTTIRSRTTERRRGGSGSGSNRKRPVQQQTSETIEETIVDERPSRRRGSTQKSQEVTTARPVPTPKPVSNRNAWYIPPIQCFEPEDGVFYAQMGPTGGKRGYPAITGHVGWGVSWYINGLLIPEINVVRGKQYTFVVEGGIDPDTPARYHPFYITDDPVGGYAYKTPEERQNIRIFAGARQTRDGAIVPTGVGRLCHWTHTGEKEADDFPSFGAFQRTLELRCDNGEPGVISWTPDENTPDTVYYQCFTHRHLGWKINVLDACDAQPEGQASAPEPSLVLPENGDLKTSPSIRIETRINPNVLFQTQQQQTNTKTKQDQYKNDENPENDDNDPKEPTTTQNIQNDIITQKPNGDLIENLEKLNLGEILVGNLTGDTNDSSDNNPATQTRDKLLESQNTKDPLEITNMMFPAGRLPLEPQFPNLRPNPNPRPQPRPGKPAFMRPNPNFTNKKIYYRHPILRRGPVVRPIPHIHPTNTIVPQNYALTKEPVLLPPPGKQEINISSTTQISPQATTEETTTPKLKPAINTGFHPETIVMENGFRPIVTKEFEKRISEDEENPEEDPGVIKTLPEPSQNSQTLTQTFEPMFIPSPLDNSKKPTSQNQPKISKRRFNLPKKSLPDMVVIVKEGRSNDEIHSDDGDPMVMAAERIQSYYLPPGNQQQQQPKPRKTNVDTAQPGQVVTYDGKIVSGTSLTSPFEGTARSSQTSFLRHTPQFGPFHGEKPPLNPSNVNIASVSNNRGSVGRGLSAPETTKLSAVRYKRDILPIIGTEDLSDVRTGRFERSPHEPKGKKVSRKYSKKFVFRTKRSPHHTGEHTAEQNREVKKGRKIYRGTDVYRRTRRSAHHTPEHTHEQKRESLKLPSKKVSGTQEKRSRRAAHHTPEHTHEQKRESLKLPSKKVSGTQEKRIRRAAHHTPEHTHEQKRESLKLPSKKVSGTQEKRSRRAAHHTPEHTHEQKRESLKLPRKKVSGAQEKRTRRAAHHTPEHTHEQKRESLKLPSKKVSGTQEKRIRRAAHHTPEHTHEQKRESLKLPSKKVSGAQEKRTRRAAHHTPEHTHEQKRESLKLPSKKVSGTQEKRIRRAAHHTPEHTHEQKRESLKLPSKKVSGAQEKRTRRAAHHTPEHTHEQKRESLKLPSKKVSGAQEKRTRRAAHHTPEHTHEQKRESLKLPSKKVSGTQEKRTRRSAHHTPEHTHEQKRESLKLPSKKVTGAHNYKEVLTTRSKRSPSPHHTPEHTAEQNMQKSSANKNFGSVFTPLLISVFCTIFVRF